MNHVRLLYGNLMGAAFFMLGALPICAENLPNKTVQEDILYKQAILEDGNLDKVTGRLQKMALDQGKPKAERVSSLLAASRLQWRHGARDGAMKAVDLALEIDGSGAVILFKARLLDAAGKVGAAKAWYKKALPLLDGDEQGRVHLRLAIMKAGAAGVVSRDLNDLITYAKQQDQGFRNRAAEALSLLGFYDQALAFYKAENIEGASAFRQYIRMADWAIKTDNAELAQNYARRAAQNAKTRQDRLYSLAIIVESHRLDGSLDQAIDYFASQEKLSIGAYQIWIDLLREQGKPGEALALLKKQDEATSTSQLRRQLIRLYQEADREEEMVAEYNDLIVREPMEARWTASLSEYYLGQDQDTKARGLWQDFIRVNAQKPSSLLRGAEIMSQMGFEGLAITSLEAHMEAQGASIPMLFFLFELNKRQGKTVEVEKILARLDDFLSLDAPERVDLADAYERINQPAKAVVIWEGLAKHGNGLKYEEKMRLARLYGGLDKLGDALTIWQALWHENATPARRAFAQSRMLMLVEDVDKLDDFLIELEENLASGKGEQATSALLVQVYTQRQDKLSAMEVIDEYFGQGDEVETLASQADVLRVLQDYAGAEKALGKLMKIDSENKEDYLRSLILVLIEQGGRQNSDKIFEALGELGDIDEQAISGEFEASVLVLAGLPKAGLEAYRRTIASDMSNGDNYLLISDLLKKQDRTDEAISLLQYVVEETGDDELFVVAVDGILNMVSGGTLEDVQTNLFWARRMILERLVEGGGKIHLYTLLGDINDELKDRKGQIAAVESKLSLADGVRLGALRELITLLQPKQKYGFPKIISKADAARSLIYGRRLVSLNEELPPNVYMDIGRLFLEQEDADGALKVFNIAVDTADSKEVLTQTADLFAGAGYEDQALEQYGKSLLSDHNNIEILLKVGLLEELKGEKNKANRFFEKGLEALLRQLPTKPAPEVAAGRSSFGGGFAGRQQRETLTREYTQFYKALFRGYLDNWPSGQKKAGANFKWLEQFVGKEINRVAADADMKIAAPIAAHPRLVHMAEFVRRVAFATDHVALADGMDQRLLGMFAHDGDFIKSLVLARLDWGYIQSARDIVRRMESKGRAQVEALLPKETGELVSFQAALDVARKSQSFSRVKAISQLEGQQNEILTVARDMVQSGKLLEALLWGEAHLDRSNYLGLCGYIADIVRRDTKLLTGIQLRNSDILVRLSDVLGEEILSEQALEEILSEYKPNSFDNLSLGVFNYALKRVSEATVLNILKGIFTRNNTLMVTPRGISVWLQLMKEPEFVSISGKMADVVITAIEKTPTQNPEWVRNTFIDAEFHPSVIQDVKRVYDVVLKKTGGKLDLFMPRYLLGIGQPELAVEAFINVRQKSPNTIVMGAAQRRDPIKYLYPYFIPDHLGLLKTHFKKMEKEQGASEALATLQLDVLYNDGAKSSLKPDLDFLEEITTKYPNNEDFAARVFERYWTLGLMDKAHGVIEKLYKSDPRHLGYYATLFTVLIELDKQAEALALNATGPQDVLVENYFTNLKKRLSRWGPSRRFLLSALFDDVVPNRAGVDGASKKQLQAALKAGDGGRIRKSLKSIWQKVSNGESRQRPSYRNILDLSYSQNPSEKSFAPLFVGGGGTGQRQVAKAFDLIAEYDFAPQEFEDYLRGMDGENRNDLDDMYIYLVRAYKKHGLTEEVRRALDQTVLNDKANKGQYTIWLTLLAQETTPVSGNILKILNRNLVRHNNLSSFQLKLMARIFAQSAKMKKAAEVYQLLALKALMVRNRGDFKQGQLTAVSLMEEINRYLDKDHKVDVIRDIIRIVKPPLTDDQTQQEIFHRFIMKAVAKTLPAAEASAEFEKNAAGGNEEFSAEYMFDYAQMLFEVGQRQEALKAIKQAISRKVKTRDMLRDSVYPYSQMMGVRKSRSFVPQPNDFFFPANLDDLFPATNTPDNIGWLIQAAIAMKAWSGDEDAVTRFMLFIVHQMAEAGVTDEIKTVMADISDRLNAEANPSSGLISLGMAVSVKTGYSLRLSLMQRLLWEGRLPPEYIVAVVKRTLKSQGAVMALNIGKAALDHTHNEALLTLLISIAENKGDIDQASLWQEILWQEQEARIALKPLKSNKI